MAQICSSQILATIYFQFLTNYFKQCKQGEMTLLLKQDIAKIHSKKIQILYKTSYKTISLFTQAGYQNYVLLCVFIF